MQCGPARRGGRPVSSHDEGATRGGAYLLFGGGVGEEQRHIKSIRRVEPAHAARADDTSMTSRYYVLLSLGPLPKPDHRPTAEPPPPAEGETSRAFSSGRWSSPSRRSSSSRSRRTMQRTSLMSGHMCATTATLWCICEDGDGDLSSRRHTRRSACVEAGGHQSKGVLGLNVFIQRVLVGEDRRR